MLSFNMPGYTAPSADQNPYSTRLAHCYKKHYYPFYIHVPREKSVVVNTADTSKARIQVAALSTEEKLYYTLFLLAFMLESL